MRGELLDDIQRRIDAGQPVLLTGPRGIGKTWLLQRLAEREGRAIFISHIASKKAVLLNIARQLWEDGRIEEHRYFVDWEDVEKGLKRLTVGELANLIRPLIAEYVIILDNLHLLTEKAMLEVVLPLLEAKVAAAGRNETKAEQRRLGLISDRFFTIEVPPLTAEESKTMLWTLLDREKMRNWQAIETKVLTTANGRPGVIADMASQLRGTRGSLAEVRALAHTAEYEHRFNLLAPLVILLIAALFAGRYAVKSLDDPTLYILAMLAYASTYLIRPIMYKVNRS